MTTRRWASSVLQVSAASSRYNQHCISAIKFSIRLSFEHVSHFPGS